MSAAAIGRQRGILLVVGAAILLALALVRLPAILVLGGGQDEEYYSIPGWTLLKTGVPRIPYAPSRDKESVFYKADEALFALPPAYFVLQAGVYAVTAPSYASARYPSLAAGVLATGVVIALGVRWHGPIDGLLAGAIFGFGRALLFPATFARPDMLAAAMGLVAVYLADVALASSSVSVMVGAGLALGIGILSHPYIAVAGIAIVVEIAWSAGHWKSKARMSASLAMGTLAAVALWTPWIAMYPEHFLTQFVNNLGRTAGTGAGRWSPVNVLGFQASLVWELLGPIQAGALGMALLLAPLILWMDRASATLGARRSARMAWVAVFSLAFAQGLHPAKGYWCFPAALASLQLAREIVWLSRRFHCARWALAALIVALGLAWAPGSGLRGTMSAVRLLLSDGDSHRVVVGRCLDRLPSEGKFLVDPAAVFDVALTGRGVLLANDAAQHYRSVEEPYDYLVIGRVGRDKNLAELMKGRLWFTEGTLSDPMAEYLEVHESREKQPRSDRRR